MQEFAGHAEDLLFSPKRNGKPLKGFEQVQRSTTGERSRTRLNVCVSQVSPEKVAGVSACWLSVVMRISF